MQCSGRSIQVDPVRWKAQRVPIHPGNLSFNVPRPAVDNAPVHRLRLSQGDEPAIQVSNLPRRDRTEHSLRSSDPARARLGPSEISRRSGPCRSSNQQRRRHETTVRRNRSWTCQHEYDDKLDRSNPPITLRSGWSRTGSPTESPAGHYTERYSQRVYCKQHLHLSSGSLAETRGRSHRVCRRQKASLATEPHQRQSHPTVRPDTG